MKRLLILLAISLLVSGVLFAEEAVLIDFSKLTADILPNDNEVNQQNKATIMDFSNNLVAGNFTDEQKQVMKTSLAIGQWEVQLASSSKTVGNASRSFTQESPSKQFGTVMGVRIHFPVEPFGSWAMIKPPFEIPAFEPPGEVDDDGNIQQPEEGEEGASNGITGPSRFEDGYGVVKNVGTIKAVAVNAYGLNFPHRLSAILVDNQGTQKNIILGPLNYDGWAELTWTNPQYVSEVRNRDLRLYPLYPFSTPFVKFGGFLIQRDGAHVGGDFITYFKDVKIIYDKAVLDTERDIDDESVWKIIQNRETDKKKFEMERFGQNQVLRYLDSQKQAKEESFTPSGGEQEE